MSKLRKDEKNGLVVVSILALGASTAGYLAVGPIAAHLVAILLLLLLVATLVVQRREQKEEIEGRFRDLEALQHLQHFLDPVAPLPRMGAYALSPQHVLKMVNFILVRRSQVVVEFGSGVSTLISAYCMKKLGDGGHVTSYESDTYHAEVTRSHLRLHGLEAYATVVDAPISPVDLKGEKFQWYGIEGHPLPENIDLLFVDGPPRKTCHLARYPALPIAFANLAAEALILLDDADRRDERTIVARWQAEHPGVTLMQPNYDTPNLATLNYSR